MGVAYDESSDTVSIVSSSKSTTQSRSKVAMVLISGVGFLADAYDLFVIDFVVAILSATALTAPTNSDKGIIVSSTLAGAVIGQLFFGIAADFLGRRIMFVSTAFLVVLGSVASALVGWGYSEHVLGFSVFHQLALCRFILGCGIGGEYPLSATVSAETETKEELFYGTDVKYPSGVLWYLSHKPNSIATVFSMQGVGMLLSPLIVLLCISLGMNMEATWRLCLGIGAVPSAIAFIFRWKMSETNAFQQMKHELSVTGSSATATSLSNNNPNYTAMMTPPTGKVNKLDGEIELQTTTSESTQNNNEKKLDLPSGAQSPNLADNANSAKRDNQETNTQYNTDSNVVNIDQQVSDKEKANATKNTKHSTTLPNQREPQSSAQPHKPVRYEPKKLTLKGFMNHVKKSLNIIRSLKYVIIGTSVTWFLIDVTLYGTGSFKSVIVAKIFMNTEESTTPVATNEARRRLQFDEIATLDDYSLPVLTKHSTKNLPLIDNDIEPIIGEFDLAQDMHSTSATQDFSTNSSFKLYDDTLFIDSSTSDVHGSMEDDNSKLFLKPKRQLFAGEFLNDIDFKQETHPEFKRPVDFNSIKSPHQFQRVLLQRILNKPVASTSYQLRNLADIPATIKGRGLDAVSSDRNSNPVVDPKRARETVMLQARMGAIVALLAIPGYVLSLLFIHRIGTQQLQFWGFLATALVFVILGVEQLLVRKNIPVLELILFGLTFLCSNFGPNTTTFIIPTQVYPTIIRATCHGFSAAMGKLGGVVGTSLFSVIEESFGLGWLLVMCGLVSVVGALFTFLIPKDLKSKKHSIHKQLDMKP